jgi:outer membrane protein
MRKKIILLTLLVAFSKTAYAADLLQVYQQALFSDPTYQAAVSQRMADKEGVPINGSQLLPQANINGGPSLTRFHESAASGLPEYSTTSRGYSLTLTLTQTVFNYGQFKALSSARATSNEADATLNAAAQDLMLRVSQAYFAVLRDEDNLIYSDGNKKAFSQQYDQIHQEFNSGMKTTTDIDIARSSYDTAAAAYIAAETALANDQENLRAITGNLYSSLAKLSNRFPLISPQPANIDEWVQTARLQNWAIKANTYAVQSARENIKQQFAGHLPTVSLQGAYNVGYNNNLSGNTTADAPVQQTPFIAPNKAHTTDASVTLNLGVPIFAGGAVVAQTNQARYRYQVALQKLEAAVRATENNTRQSYLGIQLGIQQLQADKQAIKSAISSLNGMRSGFHVGTQTLVDVLNQQQKVFQAQTQYAADRYAYVNNLLLLKQAAGTLSEQDLQAINGWLVASDADDETPVAESTAINTKNKRALTIGLNKSKRQKKQHQIINAAVNKQLAMGGPDLVV